MTIPKAAAQATIIAAFVIANAILIPRMIADRNGFSTQRELFDVRAIHPRVTKLFPSRETDEAGREGVILVIPDMPGFHLTNQVYSVSPFKLDSSNNDLRFLWHIRLPVNSAFSVTTAAEGVGRPGILSVEKENTRLLCYGLDTQGNKVWTIALESLSIPFPESACTLHIVGIDDIDGDKKPELILTFSAEWAGLPRGIAAFDLSTGKRKFEYLTGATPYQTEIKDINGDARKEIILSAWSPHNGVKSNGTDDDHSYLFLLDSGGRLLWRKVLGGYFTEVHFASGDLDGDDRTEIVTARACHRAMEPDPGELNVFDAVSGEQEATLTDVLVSFSRPLILSSDNEIRNIVVGDSAGGFRLLNNQLREIRSYAAGARIEALAEYASDEGQAPWILARTSGAKFMVFNGNLRPLYTLLHKEYSNGAADIAVISDGRTRHIVLNADNVYLLSPRIQSRMAAFWASLRSPQVIDILLLLMIDALIIALAVADKHHRAYRKEENLRRDTDDWISSVQEIVHQMRNPLFTVQLEAEKLAALNGAIGEGGNSGAANQISESILEDVKAISRRTKQLMQIAVPSPRKKPGDLNALVRSLGTKYASLFGGKIEVKLDLVEQKIVLPFDEAQMQEALLNLIENALDAMPGGGKLSLETHVRESPLAPGRRKVVLEIADSGIGIPDDRIGRIFEPLFSTKKEGMGLGLFIAKRIVEAHDGTIQVQSREGVGTRFAITFPWKGR